MPAAILAPDGWERAKVGERDTRQIIRQWNREIDAQRRDEAERQADRGPWRAVSWLALWFLWLGVLALVVGLMRSLH